MAPSIYKVPYSAPHITPYSTPYYLPYTTPYSYIPNAAIYMHSIYPVYTPVMYPSLIKCINSPFSPPSPPHPIYQEYVNSVLLSSLVRYATPSSSLSTVPAYPHSTKQTPTNSYRHDKTLDINHTTVRARDRGRGDIITRGGMVMGLRNIPLG